MTGTEQWQDWSHQLWHRVGGVSVRTKILGIILAMVIFPGLIATLQVRAMVIRSLREQLQQHSLSVAREVATHCADLVACHDVETLEQVLRDAWHYNQDLRYILVLDSDEQVLAFSHRHDFASGFTFQPLRAVAWVDTAAFQQRAVLDEGERIWETVVPIQSEDTVGFVRVGMGEERMWAAVDAISRRIVLGYFVVSVLGIVAAFALTWLFTRPIMDLVAATEGVAHGDYAVRLQRWADDEIGDLTEAFNVMVVQLQRAEVARQDRERLRQFYLKRVIRAQEEERRRVARELHDETGQALASLMLGLHNVELASTPDETRSRLGDLRGVLASTLERVKRLAYDLRPSALDDLGLVAALTLYAHQYKERFGVEVEVQAAGWDSHELSPEVETTTYRIVQEALLNAAKYAACSQIAVLLQMRDGHLVVIVEDNGCGFDAVQVFGEEYGRTKLGLYGMRERAELVGGHLDIESEPGKGCSIFLTIPTQDNE